MDPLPLGIVAVLLLSVDVALATTAATTTTGAPAPTTTTGAPAPTTTTGAPAPAPTTTTTTGAPAPPPGNTSTTAPPPTSTAPAANATAAANATTVASPAANATTVASATTTATTITTTATGNPDFGSADRCTAGVTGDPHHYQICPNWAIQTCELSGTHQYFLNNYIEVTVTNQHVNSSRTGAVQSRVTTVRKVVMKFTARFGSNSVTYTAENAQLPSTFDGGASSINDGDTRIEVASAGSSYIRMYHRAAGIYVYLRMWRGNYFFTLRMSKALYDLSTGEVKGCPTSETINIATNGRRRRNAATCGTVSPTALGDRCRVDCDAFPGDDECSSMSVDTQSQVLLAETDDTKARADANGASEDSLSDAEIIGIAVGSFVGVIVILLVIYGLVRLSRSNQQPSRGHPRDRRDRDRRDSRHRSSDKRRRDSRRRRDGPSDGRRRSRSGRPSGDRRGPYRSPPRGAPRGPYRAPPPKPYGGRYDVMPSRYR